TTTGLASMSVETVGISGSVFSGGHTNADISVSNHGEDDLAFRLSPSIDAFPGDYPAMVKSRLFAIKPQSQTIVELSTQTGLVVRSLSVPEKSITDGSLAYDGTYLYYGSPSGMIYLLNSESGAVVRSFSIPNTAGITGLAWTGKYLYCTFSYAQYSPYNNKIVEIDPAGSVHNVIDINAKYMTGGGKRNSLFVLNEAAYQLIEINPADGRLLSTIPYPGTVRGLAYSGVNDLLYVADLYAISVVDPSSMRIINGIGNDEYRSLASDGYAPNWLFTDEQVYSVPPGGSVNVSVQFVANGLNTGQYFGSVLVIPVVETILPASVPAVLQVTGGPDLKIPNTLNFGDQFMGFPVDSVMDIQNHGFGDLVISNILSSSPLVAVSLSSTTLRTGEKIAMNVSVASNTPGPINADIQFSSNDPDEPILHLPLTVKIMPSPDFELTPSSITGNLGSGSSSSAQLSLTNTGLTTLHWRLLLDGTTSPGYGSGSKSSGGITLPDSIEYLLRQPAPELLKWMIYEENSGYLFAGSYLNSLFKYDIQNDAWFPQGRVVSDVSGTGVSFDWKLFLGGTQLNVYSIASNTWSFLPLPEPGNAETIATDGQVLYVSIGKSFYRYSPVNDIWTRLADSPASLGGSSYHSGVIVAHINRSLDFSGDGKTVLYKYFVETNSWILSDPIPGMVGPGSVIDPASGKYYALTNTSVLSVLDIRKGSWYKTFVPATAYNPYVFAGHKELSGIYLAGERNLVYYPTEPASNWLTASLNSGNLAPGSSQVIDLELDAKGLFAGAYTSNLTVVCDKPVIKKSIPLSLNVTGSPDIAVKVYWATKGSPEISIGEQRALMLDIRNNGTATLHIASISADHPDFTPSINSLTLPIGEKATIYLFFKPTLPGPQTGTFTITSDDPDESSLTYSFSAIAGLPPHVAVVPSSVTVSLIAGDVQPIDFTLSNSGGLNAQVYMANDWQSWSLNPTSAFGLVEPGQVSTIQLSIDAAGKAPGTYNGTLFMTYGGPDTYVPIPATIEVTTDAPGIRTERRIVDFGNQYVGRNSDNSLKVENAGTLPLIISSVTSDISDFRTDLSGPLTILPGSFVDLGLHFFPQSEKTYSGHLTLTTNDPTDPSYIVSLVGVSHVFPSIVVSPASISESMSTDQISSLTVSILNPSTTSAQLNFFTETTLSPAGKDPVMKFPGTFVEGALIPDKLIAMFHEPGSEFIRAIVDNGFTNYIYDYGNGNWSKIDFNPLSDVSSPCGVTMLRSKIYLANPSDSLSIIVFDPRINDVSYIDNLLGSRTGTISTDGNSIYLGGGGKFMSLNPKDEIWTNLPIPTIQLDGKGGLSYFNGYIYAHEGTGNGFARYSIADGSWERLLSMPGIGGPGSAIDTKRQRFYTHGVNHTGDIFEYDIRSGKWSVIHLQGRDFSDVDMVYFPGPVDEGLYIAVRSTGSPFILRYQPIDQNSWLGISGSSEIVAPGETKYVTIQLDAKDLNTGTYNGSLGILCNGSNAGSIPVTLQVTNPGPSIVIPSMITGTVIYNIVYTTTMTIRNNGNSVLNWAFTGSLPNWLSMDKSFGSLDPSGTTDIILTVGSNAPSYPTYTLTTKSNDRFAPHLQTELKLASRVNNSPQIRNVPNQLLFLADGKPLHLDMTLIASDLDNDPMTFQAYSSNPAVASTTVDKDQVFITPLSAGTTDISINALDTYNGFGHTGFSVRVFGPTITTGLEPVRINVMLVSPNPFNHDFKVLYGVLDPVRSMIKVIDDSGRTVIETKEIQEYEGLNEIQFDGSRLSSGLYNCLLIRNGQFVQSIRIVKN
ncbi:MAG: choice-of-anchor D domain-containing protein, partial [Bacteroidetes bacterium]|nr:choice-of-anchor D domain-containing protein [Bacteroidota bacterium]